MPTAPEVAAYYEEMRCRLNIGTAARELLGDRLIVDSPSVLKFDCPHHVSQSGTSLHVEPEKGLWCCWGCRVQGDVIQLVEFVQTGCITCHTTGVMPASHRAARDWVATRAGMPLLAHLGLSTDEIEQLERRETSLMRARAVLTAAAAWYQERLRARPDVMAWMASQYGFTDAHVARFQIGFADVHGLRQHLYDQGFTHHDLLGCGLYLPNETGHEEQVTPFFANRLMFPYHSRGQVCYFIGRQTPWTDDSKYEESKYKKLMTHGPGKRAHLVAGIENNRLYNEDLLSTRPTQVIITEGITDCIALLAHDFPAISPVTISLRKEDLPRLISRLRGVEEVCICQDNEVSHVGWEGALHTAQQLQAHGIRCRVAQLPLGDTQREARQQLQERYNISEPIDPQALKAALAKCTPEEEKEVEHWLAAAKIDVCQFFRDGRTAADFREVLQQAQTPLMLAIAALSPTIPLPEQRSTLDALMQHVAQEPVMMHTVLLREIEQRLAGLIGMTDLRKMLKGAEQTVRTTAKAQQRQDVMTPPSDGELVYDDGQRRLYLVNNGIVRHTTRETAQGAIVTRTPVSNCHVRLTQDVIEAPGDHGLDELTLAKRHFNGRLIGAGWESHFTIEAEKWPLNTELASQITKAGGTDVLLEAGPLLDDIRRVAHRLSTEIEHCTVFRKFGFHPTAGFVTPTLVIRDGEIYASASEHIIVETTSDYNKAQNLDLLPASPEEVRDLVSHLLTDFLRVRPLHVTLPVLAHALTGPVLFYGPLIDHGFTPFILFLGGASGQGKTETARLAQCLWGDFATKEHLASWASTTNINRQEAARCSGGLWVMDDYKRQQIVNEATLAAENMFNAYADMQSRKRATAGAKVATSFPMKCMLLVTSEDASLAQTSSVARSLIVDFRKEEETEEIYLRCKRLSPHYRKVPAYFIAWWQRQDYVLWGDRVTQIREMFQAKLRTLGVSGDNTSRLVNNATLSLLALEAFQAFCFSLGITPQELTGFDLSVEYSSILEEMLVKMHSLTQETKPGVVFLHLLAQLLLSGQVYLLDGAPSAEPAPSSRRIGQYRWQEQAIDLFSSIAMSEVRELYRRSEELNLVWSTKAIGSQLAEEGFLCDGADQQRAYQQRARIQGEGRDGKPIYVWRIRLDRFEEILAIYRKRQ